MFRTWGSDRMFRTWGVSSVNVEAEENDVPAEKHSRTKNVIGSFARCVR